MKKVILTLAVAMIALSANAQHKFFLGFEGGVNTSGGKTSTTFSGNGAPTSPADVDADKVFGGSFMPYLGYSLTENIAVGLGLGISSTKTTAGAETTLSNGSKVNLETKSNTISVSPFVRYTTQINDNFAMWGQLNVEPAFGKEVEQHVHSGELMEHEAKLSGFGVLLRPGFNYKVGERWIFTGSYGSLGYASAKATTEETDNGITTKQEVKANTFGLNLNWNTLRVGFNFLF